MRFLVDAQLPARLARFLTAQGHDATHTSQLPDGNRTTDAQIAALADGEERVLVTKDRDFRDGHLLRGAPRRLLVVATGNITNDDLLALFETDLATILRSLSDAAFVELDSTSVTMHRDDRPQ
ncbi:MAG: DUF5615 family PIN-like protein [Solirubrobacteraceae bacterium MAG38_C4-C5]|nr:DUF5615 family PIN-like protein [Candidatus Siliceabacter maunaloa]